MDDDQAAHIRPYPKVATDIVDDKLQLAELLKMHASEIAPPTITSPDSSQKGKLYFVKHRFGAQGKSVYVYNRIQLEEWWQRSKNPQDFVIQQEVPPALDEQGRKFVLRAHILMLQSSDKPVRAFLHKDIICLPHASPYAKEDCSHANTPKSAYISQAGKKHPPPFLLQDISSPNHPAAGLWPNIRRCTEKLVSAGCCLKDSPFQQPVAKATTCFALLGADLLVSSEGQVIVCEVNSHPALGWGTMSQVPAAVFRGLIEDSLSIIVFDKMKEGNKFESLKIHDHAP
ncbi:expressed unknown protein [Seminavis robusta]|uniref:Tubulin--tyrosine ligase n=1 Tax=Seminavis robusta TaxID=568900 RepID=A0A9N8I0U9_9STRA|nr:expressed unknown protein [Seminavis robusta]|eukprot:Sro2900_g339770.1 n/a (286) ;mRNA; r:9631-10488